MTDLIIDAFSNIDQYKEVVPCVSELFIVLKEEILEMKSRITLDVALKMNLISNDYPKEAREKVISHLDLKLETLFQEYSLKIFSFSDAQIDDFL